MKNSQRRFPLRANAMMLAGIAGMSLLPIHQASHAADLPMVPMTSSGSLLRQNLPLFSPVPASQSAADSNAGADLQTATVQTLQSAEPRVRVLRFVQSEALPEPAATNVRAMFAQVEGRELRFSQVARVRNALNTILRREAGVLTYATLPSQEVNDGTVRFEIHHGRIAKVALDNTSLVSTPVLTQTIWTPVSAAAPDLAEIEQAVRRMEALPGVAHVQPMLSPGQEIGTTDVVLQVTPAPRVHGVVLADNSGSATSGRNRVGAQLAINSPLGIGDQLQGVVFYAPPKGQSSSSEGGNTVIGQASYELPLGYGGVRGGASFTRVQYRQGGADQDVFDGNGSADVVSVYINKPLLDHADAHLTIGAMLDHKRLRDGFVGIDSKRNSVVGGIKLFGDQAGTLAGRSNALQFDAAIQIGSLQQKELGIFDFGGSSTAGRFSKFNGNVQYAQSIGAGFSATLKSSLQLASRHLDGSEQMSLSGTQGVRGYGPDLTGVDRGALLQASLNHAIEAVSGLTASVFYDYGRGQVNKQQSFDGAANTFTAQSPGIGLNYQYQQKAALSLNQAWPVGAPPQGQPASTRGQTWLSGMLAF
ncbi:MAG: ShlB/FhaC/HecB family hemolysin secretion/activation protein [Collimonas sp.]|uniref:ShlB/FhaC/HecB family hemolysin secretion/activation protein n=1 Tax=Collimonas sp. TaxID=1963772 RepID=UPI003266A0EC